MKSNRHIGVLPLVALAALVCFFAPPVEAADFELPDTFPPDIIATHAGASVQSFATSTQRIAGADLDAVNAEWMIETTAISNDVPIEHGVIAIFRGTEGNIDGAPQANINYAVVHTAFTSGATTTVTSSFNLPLFGDPDTPSGSYTIVVAELPETFYEFDEGLGDVTGVERTYTDEDFANWFAGIDTYNVPNESSFLEFEYEAGEVEIACTEQCFSNVLFLPGIEASRLYQEEVIGDGETRRWEPFRDADVEALFLKEDGKSVNDNIYTKEGDVIDELPVAGQNIYKSFIAKMAELKTEGTIADWRAAAYDWRLSLDDILESGKQDGDKISYLEATSTPYIIQTLRNLAETSKSGKVTIIAHSNGGLVAKRLTQVLGAEAAELIDKIIFVAVPQVGSVDALAIAMHGEGLGPFDLAASKSVVRTFASTSPMVYNLLPSSGYFTQVDNPVVTFDESLPEWRDTYGDVVHSEERLKTFLTGTYGKAETSGDVSLPVQLNENLFDEASSLHAILDTWQPPTGVELIQIAGWGIDSTVKGIEYVTNSNQLKVEPNFTIDGDGRVVVPSSLWTSGAANYWIDLKKYSRDHWIVTFGGRKPFEHSTIFEVDELQSFLVEKLKDEASSIYTYISQTAPIATNKRLLFELHSPLTLDLYDASGNHTGVSTTTNQVEEGIPGTYYMTFGEQKYVFADSDTTYNLVLDGYDSGTFTLIISESTGDNVISTISFNNVPVTPETVVALNVGADINSISELQVDEDGDGEADFSVSTNGTITDLHEEEPESPPPSSGGGNGPPVGLFEATSTEPVSLATTTTAALLNQELTATPSTTTAQVSKKVAAVKPVPKSKPPVGTLATSSGPQKATNQVAAAAQVTKGGLWTRIYKWIIKKFSEY